MDRLWITLILLTGLISFQSGGIRVLNIDNQQVRTTFRVDSRFLGIYRGKRQGYLELRPDGSGTYRYDDAAVPGFRDCSPGEISLFWGFILTEDGEPLRFERPYGFSYPIVYIATEGQLFQGCSRTALIDYLLEYRNGSITVSSSDDWVRQFP
jgi:hypothetical protein